MLLFLLAAIFTVLPNYGNVRLHADAARIVNGRLFNITDAPYQASIFTHTLYICGATIISPDWLLTAAHCLDDFPANYLQVRVGTAEPYDSGETIQVADYVNHPSYKKLPNDEHEYDFALLQLNTSIELDETKQPVVLPESVDSFGDGEICIVSGWGRVAFFGRTAEHLNMVAVPLVNQQLCQMLYQATNYINITESMICAGYMRGERDACEGDSGGPLVNQQGVLIGVVSGGKDCGRPMSPGIYARVTIVRDWIREVSGV